MAAMVDAEDQPAKSMANAANSRQNVKREVFIGGPAIDANFCMTFVYYTL
jgi:hypothetical protein